MRRLKKNGLKTKYSENKTAKQSRIKHSSSYPGGKNSIDKNSFQPFLGGMVERASTNLNTRHTGDIILIDHNIRLS